jgi:hypothetical protein
VAGKKRSKPLAQTVRRRQRSPSDRRRPRAASNNSGHGPPTSPPVCRPTMPSAEVSLLHESDTGRKRRTAGAAGLKRSRRDSKERAPRSAGRRTQRLALLASRRMAVAVWWKCGTLPLSLLAPSWYRSGWSRRRVVGATAERTVRTWRSVTALRDDEGARLSRARAQTGAGCLPGTSRMRGSARSARPPRAAL